LPTDTRAVILPRRRWDLLTSGGTRANENARPAATKTGLENMVGGVLVGMRHAPVDIPGTWAALRCRATPVSVDCQVVMRGMRRTFAEQNPHTARITVPASVGAPATILLRPILARHAPALQP